LSSPRVLVVTNDFPPRRGGIESFVWSLCQSLDPADVVVYTSTSPGAAAFDAAVPFPVLRDRSTTLLPTPAVSRRVQRVLREHRCNTVVFGASAPLGLLAPAVRTAGAARTIALTHGHETWWARTPGARRLLRRIGEQNDVLTYVSEYCRSEIARALTPAAAARMRPLSPGVDLDRFQPGLDGTHWRLQWGIGLDQQVVLSAARLVRRKGHDVLLDAWVAVTRARPDAVLVIAGDGPMRTRLERRRHRLGIAGSVRIVPGAAWADMPGRYAAADIFALPCRTRRGGLEPEAFGIAFLEAAACGLPVVVGRSGGAPETVADGDTGLVVNARRPSAVSDALVDLLCDPEAASEMGRRGWERVAERNSATDVSKQLADFIAGR
jgi:phosphatidyl-myo-inositol dimannoside synthase